MLTALDSSFEEASADVLQRINVEQKIPFLPSNLLLVLTALVTSFEGASACVLQRINVEQKTPFLQINLLLVLTALDSSFQGAKWKTWNLPSNPLSVLTALAFSSEVASVVNIVAR